MTEELNRKVGLKKQFPLLMMLSIIGIVSLVVGILASSYLQKGSSLSNQADASKVLQEFLITTWKDPKGQDVVSEEWKGKTLVINFWASWCPPCVEEMPLLAKVSSSVDPSKIQFVGIGIDSPSNIRDFLEKFSVPYPILNGGLDGTNWSKKFGNQEGALPYTIILDPDGHVIFTKLGKITEEEINKALNPKI